MDCAFPPFLAPFCRQTLSAIPPLLPLDTVRSIYLHPYCRLYFWTFSYSCTISLLKPTTGQSLDSVKINISPSILSTQLGGFGNGGNWKVFQKPKLRPRTIWLWILFALSCFKFLLKDVCCNLLPLDNVTIINLL